MNKVITYHKNIVNDNKKYLKWIIGSWLFCTWQGIRGNKEDQDSLNNGYFQELLSLCANDSEILKWYYLDQEKYLYISDDYTNQLYWFINQQCS